MAHDTSRTPPGQGAERVPLTAQQEFLRAMDHGDDSGPFGPYYHIVGGWRVHGRIDVEVLRAAMTDLVARHEALRTSIVVEGDDAHQAVRPAAEPELTLRDLPADGDRDQTAERFACEIEAGPFPATEHPALRMVLGRFDHQDGVLVLIAHHTMVDGWSAQVVMRDLAEFYAARRGDRLPVLPQVRQPREYVAWQRAQAEGPSTARALAFWRENLRGARMTAIPTDRPRPSEGEFRTGWHRFVLDERYGRAVDLVARRTRSSPFMVYLAAYLTYLRDRTGSSDLVVPTFTPGRSPGWIQDTVGSFYNFLPLRVDIGGGDLASVIERTRTACLAAYDHEIPFLQLSAAAPDLMDPVQDPGGAAAVFQVVQSPFIMSERTAGDVTFSAIRSRTLSAAEGSQLPDGLLWSLEPRPDGVVYGKVGYTTNMFDEDSVAAQVRDLTSVLRDSVVASAAE
ncbi:condensation protein [Actinoalloteichus sp. AHMU CJ021]|uniref:condensation domain-containing protein n=2 Tax=Pseudonocardiaceae TaxID=2070 RepID=UPI00068E70BA|nr:condensation domain-containing protein [Actinoalloteichus caeruleus]AUS81284.1 condensation protein [Actinoalloteichus sp. AHMU CJ021]